MRSGTKWQGINEISGGSNKDSFFILFLTQCIVADYKFLINNLFKPFLVFFDNEEHDVIMIFVVKLDT